MTKTAGRVIFALSFSRARLESTFFPSDIENVLVSYHYLQRKDADANRSAIKLLGRIRKKAKILMIDSGIFTMKAKVLGANVAGKLGAVPVDHLANMVKKARKQMPMFVDYAKRYTAWLDKHDRLYDWAFDLDVDQFLGLDVADKFYAYMVRHMAHPRKIIRIWHSTRTFDDWKRWCASGDHDYLAVEGGGSHGRDVGFYQKFIDVAHKYGVKVHVLAATDVKFLTSLPIDTADSSSWMMGSRYGLVSTPWGIVSFGYRSGRNNWHQLAHGKKEKILKWLRDNDLEDRPDVMASDWVSREFANIQLYLEGDVAYDPKGKVTRNTFLG